MGGQVQNFLCRGGVIIFYRYYLLNPTNPLYPIKNERSLTCFLFCLVFEPVVGTVKAIIFEKEFVNEVTSGSHCGVVLDRTCFYAEQGGQIYDQGFLTKEGDEVSDQQQYSCNINTLFGVSITFQVAVGSSLKMDNQNKIINISSYCAVQKIFTPTRGLKSQNLKVAYFSLQ